MDNKTKVSTVVSILSGISVASGLYRDGRMKYNDLTQFTATVSANSYVHPILLEWLNEQAKPRRVKLISNRTGITRFYDGTGSTKVNIGGHLLTVFLESPDVNKISDYDDDNADNLVFKSRTREGIDALHNFLEELTEERRKRQRDIHIFNLAPYGWEPRNFPHRDLDSVILDKGIKEDLIADLETFFSNEEQYERIGVPWHRGYLFHGPPGNGKSSLAASIAIRYRMSLYNLPLSGIKDDKQLSESIARVSDNSVLLLEDIDIFSKSIGREQAESGPTLAGLLNALDGVSTPHGLMTFMTTNHIENLDPALIRPGRIDKRIELTAPTRYQIETMFEYAYGEPLGVEPKQFPSMAAFSNVLKMFTTDPESARLEIKLQ